MPQERLTGAAWKTRLEMALRGRPQVLREKDAPAFGLKVTEVYQKGQAERLGVKIGDRLVRFREKPILGSQSYKIARAMAPGKLMIWSNGFREVELEEGSLGVDWTEEWRPESAYLQSSDHPRPCDDFVLAACLSWRKDEETAETALFHATAAGYHGWITSAIMARLCHENGRHEDAMAFGWFAKEDTPLDGRGPVLQALHHSAVLLGHLDRARTLSESQSDYAITPLGWDYSSAEARYPNVRRGAEPDPTPCLLGADARFPAEELRGLEPNGECVERDFSNGHSNNFSFSPGGAIVFLGPAVRNPAFSVDFEMTASAGLPDNQYSAGRFHLVDIASGVDEILASLEFRPGSGVGVAASGLPQYWLSGNSLFATGTNTIDLALKGPWCELRVNGRCVLLALVPDLPGRKVALAFELWNLTGRFLCMERRDLKGGASEGTLPPIASRPVDALKPPPPPRDPALAWYHAAFVGSYIAGGSRSAAWDDVALGALTRALPYLRNVSNATDLDLVLEKARRAFQAGCDDPVVLFVLDRAQKDVMGDRDWEVIRRFRRSLSHLKDYRYPVSLQCILLLHSIADWNRGFGVRHPETIRQTADQILKLLPKAMSEDEVPTGVLVSEMRDLLQVQPDAQRLPLDAFQRVWAAAEAGRSGSAAALAFKGYFYIDFAWQARGSDWARNVTEQGWKLFGERLAAAAQSFEAAWRIDPKDPHTSLGMLTVALGHEEARRAFLTWWERSIAADPNNAEAGDHVLHALMPRWSGSEEALLGFGRECFARAKKQELQPCMALLLIEAHEKLNYPNSLESRTRAEEGWLRTQYWTLPSVWEDVHEVFYWVLKNYPGSIFYRSRYAFYAARCGRWKEADEQFQKLGDSVAWATLGGHEEGSVLRALARNRR